MTNYEKFVTQAQEGVVQAAKQLTKAQEQAISALKEAQATATNGLPSPSQLVEANYAFTSQLLQIQKETTLRWIEAFVPSPAKPAEAAPSSN
jgi:hypothetical protein